MKFLTGDLFWINEPRQSLIGENRIEIVTEPGTDLWQRTYYDFQHDNAPMLQMRIKEEYFSFTVKTSYESSKRFDQCGIVLYLNSDNWMKASVEYENKEFQRLGSVVTNHGYSDWASTDIPADCQKMWYRLSRRGADYCFENSFDGVIYKQMRICHLLEGDGEISFGIYACSPEQSSFRAVFTEMEISECKWTTHV